MPPSPYLAANFGSPVTPTRQTQSAIGGPLPFGQANVGGMFSGDLAGSYQSAYNTALGQNQANYSNILSGYQQTLGGQKDAQQAIAGGYNQLYNQVLGGIQGIGQSQAQAIADAYAQQSGQSQQDLINRGLGNSTVLSSVQRGTQLDKQKADIALANQVAQLTAGYQTQIGGMGLNYANQAAMQNSAQQNEQLRWMNSVNAQYPNAGQYSQLHQQQGMTRQADADRAQAQRLADQQIQAAKSAQAQAGGGGGIISRPGGGGLGPGVWGPPSGTSGGMASVTPFGLGGGGMNNYPGAGGMGISDPYAGLASQVSGLVGSTARGIGAQAGQAYGGYPAPGDTQWWGGAYGPQGGLQGGGNDFEEAGAY